MFQSNLVSEKYGEMFPEYDPVFVDAINWAVSTLSSESVALRDRNRARTGLNFTLSHSLLKPKFLYVKEK